AMLFSVEELLSSISKRDDEEILLQKANELANELHSISKNRIGIIENCENNENKLISTNIKSLDIMLFYMQNKAKKANIFFNLNIAQNIDISAFNGVLENDLSTLLADLLENAIIAVNKSTNLSKKIGIEVGCKGDIPYISIFDSAEPFANEVISNYGKQRYTTHKNEGGSGIGLMSVYEICQKYGASFHIINLVQDGYRKSVSVLFDNKNEFITR
ncbi:MAG: GHKL domain-containing protein, partial [Oscillospiraceae bacterium]|nr:GHKL domain-containing protein [Oscillospiraceae bacterium]